MKKEKKKNNENAGHSNNFSPEKKKKPVSSLTICKRQNIITYDAVYIKRNWTKLNLVIFFPHKKTKNNPVGFCQYLQFYVIFFYPLFSAQKKRSLDEGADIYSSSVDFFY
jgi:hypothetical protein